jgi:DNA-binding NarL/FixJ family response regulator
VKEPIKIVVVDDMQLWRDAFSKLLNSFADVKVIATAGDGDELFQLAKKTKFDIVMLDVEMRFGMDGIATLKKMKNESSNMNVIIMSTHHEKTIVEECLKLGAKSYLCKDTPSAIVHDQIHRVYNGEDCSSKSIELSENFLNHLYQEMHNKFKLTEKEIEIMRLTCKGKAQKVIEGELQLAERTLQRYISNVYRKTGANCRAGIVSFSIKHGIAW